jgi:hypothetical protein
MLAMLPASVLPATLNLQHPDREFAFVRRDTDGLEALSGAERSPMSCRYYRIYAGL